MLLPRDLPNARILTYGYDADIVHFWSMASQSRIGNHAQTLVNALAPMRERTGTVFMPSRKGGYSEVTNMGHLAKPASNLCCA